MEFVDQITSAIDGEFTVQKTSPFTCFVKIKQLKIHFVQIKDYNPSIFQNEIKNLKKKNEHFITVFEDYYKRSPKKIIKRLKYHFGESNRIHGRETKTTKITKPEAMEFLEKNHGNIPLKTKFNFGLLDSNKKLVAVACFGQVIRMRNGAKSAELIRFCNLSGSRVVGGLTKLIGHFKNLYQLDELMTYCDLEWSNGDNFKKLGFTEIETSTPTEFIINLNTWQRAHYSQFRNKNDWDIRNKDEYRTVLNMGSIKFIKYFSEK